MLRLNTILTVGVLIIFFSCNGLREDGKMLKVIEVNNTTDVDNSTDSTLNKFFKIKLIKDDSDLGNTSYPLFNLENSKVDTIALIGELLTFKGDKRLCAMPIMCYDRETSMTYNGFRYYSIQLEALFLINQLFLNEPFKYSPMPVLINNETGTTETIDGLLLTDAYDCYEIWYHRLQDIGLDEAKKKDLLPLENCKAQWY